MITNKYDLSNEYGIGIINNIQTFYFDLKDYEKIKEFKWTVSQNGYIISIVPYYKENGKRTTKTIYMHRLILNVVEKSYKTLVDHINHVKFDNRSSNLRLCNNIKNQQNRGVPSNNSSGVKGVSWHKNKKKWQINIWVNGKNMYLGMYDDFDKAKEVRIKAEEKYFGDFNYSEVLL